MIKVITNNMGSGDWVTVLGHCKEVLFSDHRISPQGLVDILNATLDCGAELVEVTDEQLEEGTY
jgi:hypothetical protein